METGLTKLMRLYCISAALNFSAALGTRRATKSASLRSLTLKMGKAAALPYRCKALVGHHFNVIDKPVFSF
jgi:hypothetical protein